MQELWFKQLFLTVMLLCWLPCDATAQPGAPIRVTESFLYIDDHEVRHELLMPLGALESLVPVQHDDPETLTLAEQRSAEQRALGLLDSMNPVSIDGITVMASSGKLVFFDRDVTDIVGVMPQQDLPAGGALAGVILRYETKGAPKRVAVRWSAFNEVIRTVRATLYAGEEEGGQALSQTRPVLEWVRQGAPRQPALTEVPTPQEQGWLMGSAAVTEVDGKEIFSALLKNIYRAFDYRGESAVYDALERSVTGEMLARLYLNLRRGLEEESEGGPTTRVLEVEVLDGKIISAEGGGRGFTYDAGWAVTGSVEHWGHVHTRKNLYRARFEVGVVAGAWKIKGMQVTKQERLETKLVRRGAEP